MALKYRVNRYNWLGQKLLAQHEFSSVVWLKQNAATLGAEEEAGDAPTLKRPLSDHLNYVHSLASLRTGGSANSVIQDLQRLNFYQNPHYFLLLCQALAYAGHHESVVALCRQVIGHQLSRHQSTTVDDPDLLKMATEPAVGHRKSLALQESFDSKRVFASILSSSLIDNPRLWLLFGASLEYLAHLKDAQTAFRVAAKLSTRHLPTNEQEEPHSSSVHNYFLPSTRYAELCAHHRSHIKQAMQALFPTEQVCCRNLCPNHVLAFYLYKQLASSKSDLQRTIELVTNLEAYFVSNKNPAHAYNLISLSCKQRLNQQLDWEAPVAVSGSDETSLEFVLAKSFVLTNSLVQLAGRSAANLQDSAEHQKLVTKRVDMCIESLLKSNPICWNTSAIWNNLGICYLFKRRNVASMSCLTKAHSLEPLNWRVNFNLALVCFQVGLYCKASVHLLAAKNLSKSRRIPSRTTINQIEPLITTMQALCYERLGLPLDARRLYVEATQLPFKSISDAPVLATVNYLILLYNSTDKDENNLKVQLHLLDVLEQYWLQRDKNSHQFQGPLLKVASEIGSKILPEGKVYAWMKPERSPSIVEA